MSVDNIAEAERILDAIAHVGTENRLEDEAHQRNTQTAADFPPGTSVLIPGDSRRWTVDSRWPNGDITLTRERQHLYVTADQLWRIDPSIKWTVGPQSFWCQSTGTPSNERM